MHEVQNSVDVPINGYFLFQQLSDEVNVIHTATVRHDWHGDKHDLSVQQGELIDIIRIENNPVGMWLGRTKTGNCKLLSNVVWVAILPFKSPEYTSKMPS